MEDMQSTFQYAVKTKSLPATANVGCTFGIFSIIKEPLASHNEIDRDDPFVDTPKLGSSQEEKVSDHTDDELDQNHPDIDSDMDEIQDIYKDGLDIICREDTLLPGISDSRSTGLPPPGPLKGYKYTSFEPKDNLRRLAGHFRTSPTQIEALTALKNLELHIRPKRKTEAGYQDPELDLWARARLEGMQSMLHMYTNPDSQTYDMWGASSCQTAIGLGRGCHCARRLRELCRAFITNGEVLPVNPYGDWNESMLVDENLRNEISIYLLSIGNEISAKKLMDFLCQAEIKEKYGIEKNISLRTARRYLNSLGY